jgi:hypothetical protein
MAKAVRTYRFRMAPKFRAFLRRNTVRGGASPKILREGIILSFHESRVSGTSYSTSLVRRGVLAVAVEPSE